MATIIVLIVLAVILFFLGRSFIRDRGNEQIRDFAQIR